MNPRDLAIVGAVLLLGGFAVVDALRGDDAQEPARATTTQPSEPRRETFPAPPVGGDIAFTAGNDCRLRDFTVSTGIEYPLPRIETNCDLWAAPVGNRIAYEIIGEATLSELGPVRFIDLGRPFQNLGTFETLTGVIWSLDGQRAAWCDSATSGFEYEVGAWDIETGARALRRLDFCPRAFAPDGRLASTRGRRLLVDGEPFLTARGHIDHVHWGDDGSLGLLIEGTRFERRLGRRVTHAATLPGSLGYAPRAFLSPDNCAALLHQRSRIHVFDLGCFRGRGAIANISPDNCLNRREVDISRCARSLAPRSFLGLSAVWSPDGEWIAAAELDAIAFHRVVGRYEAIRWDAGANQLAWR